MDTYIPPVRVECGIRQASFGRNITDDELDSFHNSWNILRHSFGLNTCRYKDDWSHSGCRLPFCPKCGLRARRYVCMAVLSWHHAHPDSPMSILDYRITSQEATDFLFLSGSKVTRKLTGRTREGSQMVASISTSGLMKLPEADQYWVHRRLAVLLHQPDKPLARRRGAKETFDEVATIQLQHVHLDDIRKDPQLGRDWNEDHIGGLIIGGLLLRYPKLSSLFRKGALSSEELLASLDSGQYRYYRTQGLSEDKCST